MLTLPVTEVAYKCSPIDSSPPHRTSYPTRFFFPPPSIRRAKVMGLSRLSFLFPFFPYSVPFAPAVESSTGLQPPPERVPPKLVFRQWMAFCRISFFLLFFTLSSSVLVAGLHLAFQWPAIRFSQEYFYPTRFLKLLPFLD